ncbi:MurT ligase domain-containing protein [Nocardia sp. CDC159]|uniref:Lipid II isoglutaminyl synthase (glutamine-hydrolyzing) subunit MurT n=1 Tax=Nocardia pulmonis TaxID=2951408 RepID=A0A9X2E2G3_9NOCA|nr:MULTISPECIES: MurT ligase domain-containing protein [Nocardia]MCM6772669.1 MurT ligase domain-containing protein [Nocardia pulmonis]MCM6786028.1 MurT ligase domain-containing protein [Nocardia sp. CDC159]
MADISVRGRLALRAAAAASWASQKAGRGKGSMIGGLIALRIDPTIMTQLGRGRRTVLVTGTNGKSTTTRMTTAALSTLGPVATQADGANMDAGIVAALSAHRSAALAAIEVDELHLPHVADALNPAAVVLLNLSRDQLDRVGEINMIERKLRAGMARHPDTVLIANCDDVLVTSIAYDHPNVVWVAAGSGWSVDATSCPRSGEPIVWEGTHWRSTGADFHRPEPDWWVDEEFLYGPDGLKLPLHLALPGRANRGNAAQAVAAAVALGAEAEPAADAAATVREIAGRYRSVRVGEHTARLLLAKNPAGWQEALSMIDPAATGLVIAVNGQVPDGEDLSWLWDVRFEHFEGTQVVAAGERATDLAVRLTYAGVEHTTVANPLRAIASCPPGRVEVLANYTAFRDLNRDLEAAR